METIIINTNNNVIELTSYINETIRTLSLNGGGTILFKEGLYNVGTINLMDNITLEIGKDAIVKMSDDINDFKGLNIVRDEILLDSIWDNCQYNGKPSQYFINAVGKNNIKIIGDGTIDGNESIFYGRIGEHHIDGKFYPRVPLIYLENCKNVVFEGITLTNSAFWTVHLVGCDGVNIDSISILNNMKMMNCDGIDPDHCKNVKITNCLIRSADDCIVIKTTEANRNYGSSENIFVSNCKLSSTSAAIKVGTESVSDFKNIHFDNIEISDTNRGISLMVRDEGSIDNMSFSNISMDTRRVSPTEWWGKSEPIAITAVRRHKESVVGNITNLLFKNIKAESENGILIHGDDNNIIENIILDNVDIIIKNKTKWGKRYLDLRPSEIYGIKDEKLTGIYIKNASNIIKNDVFVRFDKSIEDSAIEYVKENS